MKEKWNFIIYLLWFSYLILSAILMFGRGFLLSRKTLTDESECFPLTNFGCDGRENSSTGSCSDEDKVRLIVSNSGAPSLCVPKRSRVLFILVDALRYDFTEYDETIEKPLPYQNRLPIINKILQKWPDRARLYRFVADPPTTTLQRIQALVTGSLPTFVDASSNFAAKKLQEDTIIDQAKKSGLRLVLLGDDTWARLMPGRWQRSHALYSFHTWDLDTVDYEVDTKIYDEIKKDDWDLIIAHYLGVDHAGHRYGPNHKEMTRKLNETNMRLQKVIEMLPPDVLLYVVGDHGMTESGDHGGESKAEKTAAFFAYRGFGLTKEAGPIGREVQQTDFAPTMSAAFGRPPPAPSLGTVLLQVLPPMTVLDTLVHLSNNLKQVTQYLVRYGEESQQIPLEKLTELINVTRDQIDKAATVYTESDLKYYADDVRSLIDSNRAVFREVWVEFDSLSMLRALLLLLLAIFTTWLITEGLPTERLPYIFASSFVPTGVICMALCVGVCFTAFRMHLLDDLEHAIILSTGLVSGLLNCSLVIMHWDGISQRWYEGRSKFYERFARSALVASAAILVSNSFIIEEGAALSFLSLSILGLMAFNIATAKAALLWVSFGAALAVSRSYRGCREEQGDCWTVGGEGAGQASRAALVLALGSMACVVAVARRHISWRGYGVALAGSLACAHWAVGWGSLGSPSRSRMLARFAWLVIGLMFALLWRRDGQGAVLPLAVSGLLLYVANALVLGAAFAPAAGLALLTGFLALNMMPILKGRNGSSKFCLTTRCSSSVACFWALLSLYQFYGSGHHATLGHVRWAPAFHAGDPNHLPVGPLVTGALVSLDLFGMPLMFGACVPLLALWGRNGAATMGPRIQIAAVFSLCLKFALCFAIRVFATAIAATIHCRHLMIWGVFAPKLLFEGGACAGALLGALIGASLAAWHLPSPAKTS